MGDEGELRVRRRRQRQLGLEPEEEEEIPVLDRRLPLPPPASYSFLFSFAYLAALLVLVKLLYIRSQMLPVQLKIANEHLHKDRFIGERAERFLLPLVGLGTRVTGGYNCQKKAVEVLRNQIIGIHNKSLPLHNIVMDMQQARGDFFLAFKPLGFHSQYEGVQNIAVRIGPNPPSNHSVLVNCHYDTVPESPGASDNALNCAVMMEVLRVMSRMKRKLKHNVIFLFNGAEESPLQAAHGFVSNHFWSSEVRMVINLDSAGAGGAETVFQASDDHPWMIYKYAKTVPHPSASMAAQEIFQSGLIPSDTDFRIFRDFGHIPGLDMAHADNGFIYHTQHDTMEFIAPGVYQHTGDNLLALLLAFANGDEVEHMEELRKPEAKGVFFDILNFRVYLYDLKSFYLLHIGCVLVALFTSWDTYCQFDTAQGATVRFLKFIVRQICSGLMGVTATFIVALTLNALGTTMSWYSQPYFILPLYVLPFIAAAVVPWCASHQLRSGFHTAIVAWTVGQAVNAILLLILTLAGIRTSYLLFLLILLPAGTATPMSKKLAHEKLAFFVSSLTPGLANLLYNAIKLYIVLIPICGRIGSHRNPELVIAGLTALVCFIVSNCLLPFFVMLNKPSRILHSFMALHIVVLVALLAGLGHPYNGLVKPPHTQRFHVFHTINHLYLHNRTDARTQIGAVILPWDRNRLNYLIAENKEFLKARPIDCSSGLFCQFPIYNSRYIPIVQTAYFYPMSQPVMTVPTRLNMVAHQRTAYLSRKMTFDVTGPDHLTVIIAPTENVNVSSWSLTEAPVASTHMGRTYYILYISDTYSGNSRRYTIDLEAQAGKADLDKAWTDITVIGHYQHEKASYTSALTKFLEKFPNFAHVTPWVTSVQSHSY